MCKWLYFVDSLTTGRSTAFDCARNMGVTTIRRDLFPDLQSEAGFVQQQLFRLKTIAKKYGSAIGIGHPRPETLAGILRFLAAPESRDVEFVYISQIL
jgi:hypothetical protein